MATPNVLLQLDSDLLGVISRHGAKDHVALRLWACGCRQLNDALLRAVTKLELGRMPSWFPAPMAFSQLRTVIVSPVERSLPLLPPTITELDAEMCHVEASQLRRLTLLKHLTCGTLF